MAHRDLGIKVLERVKEETKEISKSRVRSKARRTTSSYDT